MRNKVSARAWVERHTSKSPPGIASHYLHQLTPNDVHLLGITELGIFARISEHGQQQRGENFEDQKANVRRAVEATGVKVGMVLHHIGPGWGEKDALESLFQWAKEKRGRGIVAESTDRYLRSRDFDTDKNKDAWPTVEQFEQLVAQADRVPMFTVLHPDAPPSEVRSYQRKRGQWAKGNKGGRPKSKKPGDKTKRRGQKKPEVLDLYHAGLTIPEIKDKTGIPRETVRRWIKKAVIKDPFLIGRRPVSYKISEKGLRLLGL